jgi:hypothetical protein
MKRFVENHPFPVFVLLIMGSIFGFGVAGALTYYVSTLAVAKTTTILLIFLCIIFGLLTSAMPLAYLYDLVDSYRRRSDYLRDRLMTEHRPQSAPPRPRSTAHWDSDIPSNDDIDGDGEGDDSLRRLGVLR